MIGPYIQYLFLLMLLLAVIAVAVARGIERSSLGDGFAAIRDDEMAAEASGVPTLRLKLYATTISGALMGMAGAPFPYYLGYVQPTSAFGLEYAVNSIAMPMIGGTTSWVGPLIGAILVATLQQWATVTISSELGVLIVGVLLVAFVIVAPKGIIGLVEGLQAGEGAVMATAPSGRRFGQALRRFHRARRHRSFGRRGRARRPDRPQRLGQVDAGQLHLRHAHQRDRHCALRWRADRPAQGA